jgi:hypothetical protein
MIAPPDAKDSCDAGVDPALRSHSEGIPEKLGAVVGLSCERLSGRLTGVVWETLSSTLAASLWHPRWRRALASQRSTRVGSQ